MLNRLTVSIWPVMITGFSGISLVLGTTIAYLANSYPPHRAVVETVGGILSLSGFGLMGYALEAILWDPRGRHTCTTTMIGLENGSCPLDPPVQGGRRPPQACAITSSSSLNDDPGPPSRRGRACSRSHSALFSTGKRPDESRHLLLALRRSLNKRNFRSSI